MLIQALREFSRNNQTGQPRMYQSQPIRYYINLSVDGSFHGLVDTSDPKTPAAKSGLRMDAPYIKRANKIAPQLLADTSEYLLGIPDLAKGEERAVRTTVMHAESVELTESCATATGEAMVATVAQFMRNVNLADLDLPDDFDPAAKATFLVDGQRLIDLPSVQQFWGDRFDIDESSGGPRLQCIACGEIRPTLKRHPLKIKGIIGGQSTGTDLISANEDAYFSYGLENSLIAPICVGCAEQYGTALNQLLASNDKHHLRFGSVELIVWATKPGGLNLLRVVSEPDELQIRALRNAVFTGESGGAQRIDHDRFYASMLGANGSRVAVLSWIDSTTRVVQRDVLRYFELQRIVDPFGQPGPPLAHWRLGRATVRKGSSDQPDDMVATSLLQLAFAGTPLPIGVMTQVLRRLKAEGGGPALDQGRAALIKMVLSSQPNISEEEIAQMTELAETSTNSAYLCGRLLAVLDAVQRQALGNPNATIIDRYYGAASTAPASVFGTLLHGSQNHLGKLRKTSRGAYFALEERLEDIMAGLDEFPRTLTLEEQGLFALGFYHQRARDRAQRQERQQRRLDQEQGDGGPAKSDSDDDAVDD